MHKYLFAIVGTLLASHAYAHDEPHKPAAHAHGAEEHEHTGAKETAFGRPGDPAQVHRTIMVEMRDPHEFVPAEIAAKTGEVIRFVVVNAGKNMHEMVLGTMRDLEQHNEEMKAHPDMHHEEAYMAHVASGKSGVIVWQFTKPGEYYYGCLVEDHFDMGMFGKVRVTGEPVSEVPHVRQAENLRSR